MSEAKPISEWPPAEHIVDHQNEYFILRNRNFSLPFLRATIQTTYTDPEIYTLAYSLGKMKEMQETSAVTLWKSHTGARVTCPKEVDRLYWATKARLRDICIINGYTLAENLIAMPKPAEPATAITGRLSAGSKKKAKAPANTASSKKATDPTTDSPATAPQKKIPALFGRWTDGEFDSKSGILRGPQNEEHRFVFTNAEGTPFTQPGSKSALSQAVKGDEKGKKREGDEGASTGDPAVKKGLAFKEEPVLKKRGRAERSSTEEKSAQIQGLDGQEKGKKRGRAENDTIEGPDVYKRGRASRSDTEEPVTNNRGQAEKGSTEEPVAPKRKLRSGKPDLVEPAELPKGM